MENDPEDKIDNSPSSYRMRRETSSSTIASQQSDSSSQRRRSERERKPTPVATRTATSIAAPTPSKSPSPPKSEKSTAKIDPLSSRKLPRSSPSPSATPRRLGFHISPPRSGGKREADDPLVQESSSGRKKRRILEVGGESEPSPPKRRSSPRSKSITSMPLISEHNRRVLEEDARLASLLGETKAGKLKKNPSTSGDDKPWVCSHCTYENRPTFLVCEACNAILHVSPSR